MVTKCDGWPEIKKLYHDTKAGVTVTDGLKAALADAKTEEGQCQTAVNTARDKFMDTVKP
jgi:hypothetical protein